MTSLATDAKAIWQAGVDAVDSKQLTEAAITYTQQSLQVGKQHYPLTANSRIFVIGAGKAGNGMARGVITALEGSGLSVSGWVNVPDDCVEALPNIRLHGARPAGVNEPTDQGVQGTSKIIGLLQQAKATDVCICLISGGGSALLPLPIRKITLADLQHLTRKLSSAGANIEQLNSVRKKLSLVKGGGLAQYGQNSRLATLIISDVLGDPIDIIASGPTVSDPSSIDQAINTIDELLDKSDPIIQKCSDVLGDLSITEHSFAHCHTQIIGNNATAVTAAVKKAEDLGYITESLAHVALEGFAEDLGQRHAEKLRQMQQLGGRRAYISGGEPVVKLIDETIRGKGGRNQQLVLAAIVDQLAHSPDIIRCMDHAVILSGGTDGEDGPTNAAGAFADQRLIERLQQHKPDAADHLHRNDAYTFFKLLDGLILCGPTHTNVCDLRVVLTDTGQ
tara:strand:+ start:6195 stop:7541 length:1347 start_codon:yes stop_codon:yes gene_type:complete